MARVNLLFLAFLPLFAGGPPGTQWTGGVTVESDPCLPPNNVDIVFDDRKVTALDGQNGQVALALEGELVRQNHSCGNVALVLGERNIAFYSLDRGAWTTRPVRNSDQALGSSRNFNFSLGRNFVVFSTLIEAHFYNGKTGDVMTVPLNADRLRAALAYDDLGCVITDRRVYCAQSKLGEIKIYALHDMHIRTAKASLGKVLMKAPEKTLVYYSARAAFEFIPLKQ